MADARTAARIGASIEVKPSSERHPPGHPCFCERTRLRRRRLKADVGTAKSDRLLFGVRFRDLNPDGPPSDASAFASEIVKADLAGRACIHMHKLAAPFTAASDSCGLRRPS